MPPPSDLQPTRCRMGSQGPGALSELSVDTETSNGTHITAVNDLGAQLVGIIPPSQGIAACLSLSPATRSNSIGAKSRTGPVGHSGVKWHTQKGDVKFSCCILKTTRVRQMRERERAREDLVDLLSVLFEPHLRVRWLIARAGGSGEVLKRNLMVFMSQYKRHGAQEHRERYEAEQTFRHHGIFAVMVVKLKCYLWRLSRPRLDRIRHK